MTVFIIHEAPNRVYGVLNNFLYKVHSDIYIGNISARVRLNIITEILDKYNSQYTVIFPYTNEQGFDIISNISLNLEKIDNFYLSYH